MNEDVGPLRREAGTAVPAPEQGSLYQRYRSRTFAEVAGQRTVTQTLRNAVRFGKVSHAYLFTGPRGTGKTSTARILARAVNCLVPVDGEPCNLCAVCRGMLERRSLDLVEIDGASNNSVDDVRELIARVNFRPAEARRKVFIIDEVHMLSAGAFNALLKTLEEPPEHILFLLATTELQRVPATITSRCQVFSLKAIAVPEMVERLRFICDREGVHAGDDVLAFVARQGTGSLRDALSLLEQIRAYCGDSLELHDVQAALGLARVDQVAQLAEAMARGDVGEALVGVADMMEQGLDPRQVGRQLTAYWSDALYARARRRPVTEQAVSAVQAEAITAVLRSLLLVESVGRRSDSPRWGLELAVAEATIALNSGLNSTTTARPPVAPYLAAVPAATQPLPREAGTAIVQSDEEPGEVARPLSPAVALRTTEDRSHLPADSAMAGALSADQALARWPDVLRWLRENRKSQLVTTLLQAGSPAAKGETIVVQFAPAGAFQVGQLEQVANRSLLLQAVHAVYGSQWSVRCVTIEGLPPPPSAEEFESYASDLERELRTRRGS